ncbi:hypothetical protein [Wukongibacter sp. M2B1]|uniref:hypothetical protein n=1 Tax=Wukongibacter sp. M2B1 TaxID=3088895 RepID=UPI003D7A42D1
MIILMIMAFNVNKYMIHNEFESYLNVKYPDKSFKVHWVKYDIIYDLYHEKLHGRYYAKVYCKNDDTEFTIHKYKSISERYLRIKNKKEMNSMIRSYLENKDIFYYIHDVNAGIGKKETLDTDKNMDYKKIINSVYVDYYDNSIQNNDQFTEISYKIIQILKSNGVNFRSIDFTLERDSKLYELRLEGEEINKEVQEISSFISRVK